MQKKHNMGSGHIIPAGMSKDEYVKIKRKWDKKLANDGFVDIEVSDDEGYVSPVFQKQHGWTSNAASTDALRRHSPEKEQFYRLCSIFLQCFNWNLLTKRKYPEFGGVTPRRLRAIWALYTEGYSTQEVHDKLPPTWKLGRYKVRYIIADLRVVCSTYNRHNPNGGNIDSDF